MRNYWMAVCAVCLLGGGVVCRGADSGLPKWVDWNSADQGKFITAVAVAGSKAYVASEDKGLWRLQTDGWKQCNPTGVAGDYVRSLAIDQQGRVWAGHGYHGVSVFDGTVWKNYDAPDGPLGHKVFRIAVSPVDGDVWLATDLGLTRYSIKHDAWTWITRGDGLPSDQASSLAFDNAGTLFVGMQCEGIAIGTPVDNYTAWKMIAGADRAPLESTGKGLPSSLINDLKIASDGAIFAATDAGLAVSRDGGGSWSFYRGENFSDKVQHRTGGVPEGWVAPVDPPLLGEDYCTCLAIDSASHLWVAHQKASVDQIDCRTLKKISPLPNDPKPKVPPVSILYPADAGSLWVGTSGQGAVCEPIDPGDTIVGPVKFAAMVPTLPAPATVTPRQFDRLKEKLASTKHVEKHVEKHVDLTAAFLGDDWVTRGDGAGRYGRQKVNFPFYGTGGWAQNYDVQVTVGPNAPRGGPYYFFDDTQPDDTRMLYIPNAFKRAQGEWNDGSFDKSYLPAAEGPDLWLKITVPDDGVHRLTLFFLNFDGHHGQNIYRDYVVELKDGSVEKQDADFAPPLARTRVCDFYQPVYKQFLLAGGKPYWVKIDRNGSFVGKVSGVFLDRMQGAGRQDIDSLPNPMLDADHWGPPKAPDPPTDEPLSVREARQMWDDLEGRYDDASVAPLQLPLRMAAYKLAADNGADPQLLDNWRWKLCLWDEPARLEFCRQMDAGYDKTIAQNPQVAKGDRVKMVDQYNAAAP